MKINMRKMVFTIEGTEREAQTQWLREHIVVCPTRVRDVNGLMPTHLLTYSFHDTGIGTVVTVECACGAKKDLTDYGSW